MKPTSIRYKANDTDSYQDLLKYLSTAEDVDLVLFPQQKIIIVTPNQESDALNIIGEFIDCEGLNFCDISPLDYTLDDGLLVEGNASIADLKACVQKLDAERAKAIADLAAARTATKTYETLYHTYSEQATNLKQQIQAIRTMLGYMLK